MSALEIATLGRVVQTIESSPKISSGVEGLDTILRGGFIRGRPYLVLGASGTGKTILGMQFITAGIVEGQRGLYITFEEPKNELIENMRGFTWGEMVRHAHIMCILPNTHDGKWVLPSEKFFDKNFFEFGDFLSSIHHIVHAHGIERLVIDSLNVLNTLHESTKERRRKTHLLMNTLGSLNCTTLIIGERGCDTHFDAPEEYVARGIILLFQENGHRYMEVKKMRGVGYLEGRHMFEITKRGIVVYPNPSKKAAENTLLPQGNIKVSSGIKGLDVLCNGGFKKGDVVLVVGPPGTGKTILSLQFLLEGLKRGERCLFISLEEGVDELKENCRNIIDIKGFEENGLFAVLHESPLSFNPYKHLNRVERALEGVSRVAINTISEYSRSMDRAMVSEFLAALKSVLKGRGITSLWTAHASNIFGSIANEEHEACYIADTVLLLRFVEITSNLRRALSIIKMRGNVHKGEIREYVIGERGIEIRTPFRGLEGVMGAAPQRVKALREVFGIEEKRRE